MLKEKKYWIVQVNDEQLKAGQVHG